MSANKVFFWALSLFPAFLFQDSPYIVFYESCLFALLLFIKCKVTKQGRVKLLTPAIILVSVVLCGLITPNGRVLYQIGGFPITLGALESGLKRGCIVTGMVFLSKIAISSKLSVPGKAGKALAEIFICFEQFSALKTKLHVKTLLTDVDLALCEIYQSEKKTAQVQKIDVKTNPVICAVAILITIVLYALLFVKFF